MIIADGRLATKRRRFLAFGAIATLVGQQLPWRRSANLLRMSRPTETNRQALAGASDSSDASGASADDGAHSFAIFEAFFRRHEREIFGYLWRLTGEEQTAYDLSQETFLRAWQHFDRIASYERPGGWLFRVATNLALTHQRRASAPVGAAQPLPNSGAPAISDPAWRLAMGDAVRTTLLTLTPQQRAALVLREIYGFSCTEVAAMLGISLAAAKMTLSRGRDAFRARYTQQEEQQ